MELKDLFKLSAVTVAISLTVACGSSSDDKEPEVTCATGEELVAGECQVVDQPDPEPMVVGSADDAAAVAIGKEIEVATGVLPTVRIIDGSVGAITEDTTLTADTIWVLRDEVRVGNDNADSAVLTIEEGATVIGETGGDYLVVMRGSQIMAEGSADAPIIMTSKKDLIGEATAPGQWGGLVILGNAQSNKCPTEGDCALQVEGAKDGAVFGGSNNEDNSGSLQYVVVKYAGFEIAPDNELNGITFGGVGSGTTVDYIQVHANADDGVEFFGGAVNVSHLVLTGNQDDSIDWDNGYTGTIQYAYIEHQGEANRAIEADNDGSTPDKTPMSHGKLANITAVGSNYDTADKDSEGFYFREGTKVSIYNSVLTGFAGECFEIEGNATSVSHFNNGDIELKGSVIACDEPFKASEDDAEAEVISKDELTTWFNTTGKGNALAATAALASNGMPLKNDSSPIYGDASDDLTIAQAQDLTGMGDFEAAGFVGAFDGVNDWREGWAFGFGGGNAAIAATKGCPTGSTKVTSVDGSTETCELTGRLTADLTLTADKLWTLNGPVFVGGDNADSATLTVEAGTTVYGSFGGDYLVVSRGSKIEAMGTADAPITFTSKQDVLGQTEGSGQWGGMVLLGNGVSNKCPSEGECALQVEGVTSGGVFGGTDNTDSSGTLKYVIVKNAGYEVAPDNELNGITFAGVGSGTTVEYIQVHANADDGVEFFGGAVNVKYLVLTGNKDDSIDWDNGYEGNIQFALIKHDGEANRGIEADNDKDMTKTPVSNPTISNITIIGGDYDTADKDSEGVYLREGTAAMFYNAIITNAAGECLEIEGAEKNPNGQAYLEATDGLQISFMSSVIACSENFKQGDNDVQLEAWWTGKGNTIAADQAAVLNGVYTIDATTATQPSGAFFETVDFIGAVKDADNDWTKGWAVGLD